MTAKSAPKPEPKMPAQSTGAVPAPEEMVARARSLKPKLRARSEECERIRRIPDSTLADFIDLGLHRIMQPKRFGGFEYGWDVTVECLNELAQGCGSQAWVMMIHIDYAQLIGACSPELQEEIWGDDPNTLTSSSFQPTAKVEMKDGGYNISGRWGFSSGIDESKWLIVGGMIPGRGHSYFVVPRTTAKIEDDWYVAGLAGTGSKSFTLDQVFVPEHRTITDQELNDGRGRGVTPDSAAIFRSPRKGGAGLCFGSVAIGMATGMLNEYKEIARQRIKDGRSPGDAALALRIAQTSVELDAGKWATMGPARELMQTLERGGVVSKEQRITSRRNAGWAAMIARGVSERILAAAGRSALHRTSALQRAFRDVHAATNHMAVAWDLAGIPYGEYMLGLEPVPGGW